MPSSRTLRCNPSLMHPTASSWRWPMRTETSHRFGKPRTRSGPAGGQPCKSMASMLSFFALAMFGQHIAGNFRDGVRRRCRVTDLQ